MEQDTAPKQLEKRPRTTQCPGWKPHDPTLVDAYLAPWVCALCDSEWQQLNSAFCKVCQALNDATTKRIQHDTGVQYIPSEVSAKASQVTFDQRDMGSPDMLMAVVTYHIATNQATAIFDATARVKAILDAQHVFEDTARGIVRKCKRNGLHNKQRHYQHDHRGLYSESPAGNFAFPQVPNPWATWSTLPPYTPKLQTAIPEPTGSHEPEPVQSPQHSTTTETDSHTKTKPHLPATSKSPPPANPIP